MNILRITFFRREYKVKIIKSIYRFKIKSIIVHSLNGEADDISFLFSKKWGGHHRNATNRYDTERLIYLHTT